MCWAVVPIAPSAIGDRHRFSFIPVGAISRLAVSQTPSYRAKRSAKPGRLSPVIHLCHCRTRTGIPCLGCSRLRALAIGVHGRCRNWCSRFFAIGLTHAHRHLFAIRPTMQNPTNHRQTAWRISPLISPLSKVAEVQQFGLSTSAQTPDSGGHRPGVQCRMNRWSNTTPVLFWRPRRPVAAPAARSALHSRSAILVSSMIHHLFIPFTYY